MTDRGADQPQQAGWVALRAGQIDEAQALLAQAVAERPDDAEAQLGLGLALAKQGEQVGAVAALERAAALKPREASIHYNLGLVLRQAERLTEARAAFEAALAAAPDNPKVQAALAALPAAARPAANPPEGPRPAWAQPPAPAHPVTPVQPPPADRFDDDPDDEEDGGTGMPLRAWVMAAVYGWLGVWLHCGGMVLYVSSQNNLPLSPFVLGFLAARGLILGAIMGLVIAACEATEEAGGIVGALGTAAFTMFWLSECLGVPVNLAMMPAVMCGFYGWGMGKTIAQWVSSIEA